MEVTEGQSNGPPGHFVIIPHRLWQTVTPRDLTVYCALASFANHDTGMCWPSRQTIADLLGVSVETVKRSVRSLEAGGFIRRTRRRSADGDWTSNLYQLPYAIAGLWPVGGGVKSDPTWGQNRPGGGVTDDPQTIFMNQKGATPNFPTRIPPEDCAHRPVDEDGYCTACGTTIEETA